MAKQTTVGRVGNLTNYPELGVSPKGKTYARFGIAVNPYAPKDQPKPEPDFYEVTAFDALAEHVCATLSRGDRVVVVGRPQLQEWEGKDGDKRTTKKIIADGVGPDLRFATAVMTKVAGATPETVQAEAADLENF